MSLFRKMPFDLLENVEKMSALVCKSVDHCFQSQPQFMHDNEELRTLILNEISSTFRDIFFDSSKQPNPNKDTTHENDTCV